jgi:hypothetical protein
VSVVGSSREWLAAVDGIQQKVIEAIERVWPGCQERLGATGAAAGALEWPATESREDPITRCLVVSLRRDRVIRELPFMIESQRELLSDGFGGEVVPVGYLDMAILFVVGYSKACLSFECKRLNVRKKNGGRDSLAFQYIAKGMMRFVEGKYSPEVPVGGMIGYVMDGDLDKAYRAIRRQITKHALKLRCRRVDDIGKPRYFVTEHARAMMPIELRHLLLSVP